MSLVTYFSEAIPTSELPTQFPNPFHEIPDAIAEKAAVMLQQRLSGMSSEALNHHDFMADQGGKMMGILVVKTPEGIGFLSAFSGQLGGQWSCEGFVEPLFDQAERAKLIESYTPETNETWFKRQIRLGYTFRNGIGERVAMSEFYQHKAPLEGTGDCAAPKLLNHAALQGYHPVALAEFWWGASPVGEIRHHKRFYPSCRGRCFPVLPFMLKGLDVAERPDLDKQMGAGDSLELNIVYEDDDLLLVDKPCGLLSVPGKVVSDSVLTRMQARYPDATGALLLHRLDMATSGLLLVAKKAEIHKSLQKQFMDRSIKKRYVAVLAGELLVDEGIVDLPLRVDLEDRPRQVVCYQYGKPAKTRWEVLKKKHGQTRVYFYPITGRTHQLRMHAAYKEGLNMPIVGDRLYGHKSARMLLHAERLSFTHPVTGQLMEITSPAPF